MLIYRNILNKLNNSANFRSGAASLHCNCVFNIMRNEGVSSPYSLCMEDGNSSPYFLCMEEGDSSSNDVVPKRENISDLSESKKEISYTIK